MSRGIFPWDFLNGIFSSGFAAIFFWGVFIKGLHLVIKLGKLLFHFHTMRYLENMCLKFYDFSKIDEVITLATRITVICTEKTDKITYGQNSHRRTNKLTELSSVTLGTDFFLFKFFFFQNVYSYNLRKKVFLQLFFAYYLNISCF